MMIPDSLGWLRRSEAGRSWLDALPGLVADVASKWSLDIGAPYPGGYASFVAPATTPGGSPVVIKIQYPDRESRHEAAALRAWNGNAAVRLLDHDAERHALLLERCVPGRALSSTGPGNALAVLIELVPQLWVAPPEGVGTLRDEAHRWAESLPRQWEAAGRPFERNLVDAALNAIPELAASAESSVLVHQDLHGDNVLSAERCPWLVIDPKPLAGEREFQAAPIVRSAELGATEADVRHRLDRLCTDLDLDIDRTRRWTLVQTLAWAFENGRAHEWHVQVARWLR